jgi:CBS domain-containing protein
MTPDPLVVRPETNIEAAARILLQKKVRRLPVVDDSGRLIGMFTRGDVIKAALRARKAALENTMKAKWMHLVQTLILWMNHEICTDACLDIIAFAA